MQTEFCLPSASCFINICHCVKSPPAPSNTYTVYSTHTRTHSLHTVCRCTHTSTTIATIPELSHVVYHSDSPYHTVIAAIFIVFPTVRLSAYPVELKLSSECTSLLSCRLIYLLAHTYGSHTVSYHIKYKVQSEHLNSYNDTASPSQSLNQMTIF